MKVELVYSHKEHEQCLLQLQVVEGCTIKKAILQSCLHEKYPDILNMPVGIFSQRKTLDTILHEGDRIEIYRPLTINPMEKRRLLAKKKNE